MEKKKIIRTILIAVLCLALACAIVLLLRACSGRSAAASSAEAVSTADSGTVSASDGQTETEPDEAAAAEAAEPEAEIPEASASEAAPPDFTEASEQTGPDGEPVEALDTGIQFPDVTPDYYCYDAVCWATANGIASGTSDTTFSPDDSCSRAQLVTFLWRLAGKPQAQDTESSFTDVTDPDSDLYRAVAWAVAEGITSGTSETTFSPEDAVTRAQAVLLLWRYAGQPASDTEENSFTDVPASDSGYDAVMWAVSSGIASGTSDTTFSPEDPCTRGQVVTFLYRYTEGSDSPSSPS